MDRVELALRVIETGKDELYKNYMSKPGSVRAILHRKAHRMTQEAEENYRLALRVYYSVVLYGVDTGGK